MESILEFKVSFLCLKYSKLNQIHVALPEDKKAVFIPD